MSTAKHGIPIAPPRPAVRRHLRAVKHRELPATDRPHWRECRWVHVRDLVFDWSLAVLVAAIDRVASEQVALRDPAVTVRLVDQPLAATVSVVGPVKTRL